MKEKLLFLPTVFFLFFTLASRPVLAAENDFESMKAVPETLKGIWEGKDRLVLFPENTVALKTFYGWYLDRAAENASYSEKYKRDRNNTSAKNAEKLEITYSILTENKEKGYGAYEINIFYGNEESTIPVAVIDKKLYLNFLLKKNIEENTEAIAASPDKLFMNGFWKNHGHASAIKISPPIRDKELVSYYFNEDDVYHIRYWLTDVEATETEIEEAKASFSDGQKVFFVDKYIKNGDLLYTCATGRRTTIRNISKTSASNLKFTVNAEHTICVLEDEYLVKIDETGSVENLQKIVEENNSKRKSAPKPLFPPSEINFHWKEISELEKYNPYTWNRRNLDIHK